MVPIKAWDEMHRRRNPGKAIFAYPLLGARYGIIFVCQADEDARKLRD